MSLGATIKRKRKSPRRAFVQETGRTLRDGAFPAENIVTMRMPEGYGIRAQGVLQPTFYAYAFDTEEHATAYQQGVMAGTRKLFMFNPRDRDPLNDVWSHSHRPPTGCVGLLYFAVYVFEGRPMLFIDMMSVRFEWQRFGVNAAMLLWAQGNWPNRELLFSDTTYAGHGFAKWWRSQGRAVEEQNADWWKDEGTARINFSGLGASDKKRFQNIFAAAEAQGWRVSQLKSGHWILFPPDKSLSPVVTSGSASDWRSEKNFMSELKKRGFIPPSGLGNVDAQHPNTFHFGIGEVESEYGPNRRPTYVIFHHVDRKHGPFWASVYQLMLWMNEVDNFTPVYIDKEYFKSRVMNDQPMNSRVENIRLNLRPDRKAQLLVWLDSVEENFGATA